MDIPESALQTGEQIGKGTLDPVELVEAAFERIEASGIKDDVFSLLTKPRAVSEAEAARKRAKTGTRLGMLDGVPVSWKDLFDSAGYATEAGTPLLKGRTPDEDCELLKRADAAGMICVGKTHLSELAFSGLGINPNTGTPPNIHGSELAPGGSSSGAAASVAHGFVTIGMGSDTGGSVRIPSAWNDLTGLKTTAGLLPNDGVVPLCSGFDTAGPLCNDVTDAALAFDVMCGKQPEVPKARPIEACRFLVCETITLDDCDENPKAGFDEAVEALQRAGAKVEFSAIEEMEAIVPLGPILFPYEAYSAWGREIEDHPGIVFAPVENRFLAGRGVSRQMYDQAWRGMEEIRKSYLARTEPYDAVLAPTVPISPPKVDELLADLDRFQEVNLMALRNTRFGNMLGLCALTLPASRLASGIMLMGRPFDEKRIIEVGLAVERTLRG